MTDKKHKRKALFGTLMFHVLLLLCFIFMGLKYRIPPPPEEGISINFGYDDFAGGEEQPSDNNEELVEAQEVIEETPEPTIEDVSTQDAEVTPVVKEKKKEVKETPKKKVEIEEKPTVNTKALYTGKKKTDSSSQGASEGKGDQGRIDGDPNASSYSGGGIGNDGIAFKLGGRTIAQIKKPVYESQTQGTVVVTIRVNRNGIVTGATAGAKGSTTTNAYLYAKAKEAALKTTFDPKENAPEVQVGTIIYHFRLN
jgi:TonB family protein